MKILSFGEVLWDVYPDKAYLGGAPLNFAAHLALQGAEAYIASAVGQDKLGAKTIEEVKKLGVKTDYINEITTHQTGKCLVTLDEKLVPKYDLLQDVSYDHIQVADFDNIEFDIIAFGTLALRMENNQEAIKEIIKKAKHKEVYTDLNIRPPFWSFESIHFCLSNSTIVKISDEELPIVTKSVFEEELDIEEAALRLKAEFPTLKLIIITKGAKGSLVYDCINKTFYEEEAIKTQVVSTVGAGDSFGAAFLFKYCNNENPKECLKYATKVSAHVVANKDAIPKDTYL